MGKIKFRKKLAMVLTGILCTNILWSNISYGEPKKQEKTELTSLGNYKTYNGVVWGNHVASGADVEGKLAVKGYIEAPTLKGSFDIAAAYDGNSIAVGNPVLDLTNPTFLLGGEIKETGSLEGVKRRLQVCAGTAVITDKANGDLLHDGHKLKGIETRAEAEVLGTFDEMKKDVLVLSDKAAKLTAGEDVIGNYSWNMVKAKEDGNILMNKDYRDVKNLDVGSPTGEREFHLPILNNDEKIIFYSEAETVNFDKGFWYGGKQVYSGDKELMNNICPKILWVFPNAKEINAYKVDVPGSIIAPNAVTNLHGGAINGQLFTKDLNQVPKDGGEGGQLHNFVFDWDIFDNIGVPLNGVLEIKKVDEDKKPLAGAKFEIRNEAGEVAATGTTGEDGVAKFEDLVAGKYSYKEVEAPEGYVLDDQAVDFEITSDNRVIVKEVVNKKIKGALELTKVDADNKETFLAGAEFRITDKDGKEVANGTTDANGIAKFENLPYGTYYYEETKAPEGYQLNGEKVEFKVTENGVVVKATVTNKKILRDLEIKKVDADNKEILLPGAEFTLTMDGNDEFKPIVVLTDKNGIAKFPNLPVGDYTVKETKAPEGYQLEEVVIHFTVVENGEVIIKEVSNKKIPEVVKGSLEIKKVDEEKKPLAGAKFEIRNEAGEVVATGTTGEDGVAKFEELVAGKYSYKEVEAPEGYVLDDQAVDFEITSDNRVIVKEVVNKKIKGALEITKVDADNKETFLVGAEFSITDKEGKEVANGTTDKNGIAKFENLPYGTYYYEETKAPEGYQLNGEKVEFKVTENGVVVKATVTNKKVPEIIKGSLEIKKVDEEKKPLAGAKFEIYNEAGKVVATGTTGEDGVAKFEELVAGKYSYKEVEAPEGYVLDGEAIDFEITSDNRVIVKEVVNKKIKGALEITKVDADNKETFLKGAEFRITDKDGNEIQKGITDENGIAKFENIPYGTYYYQETKAPEGYELNSEKVEFKVTENGVVVKATVTNKKVPEIVKGSLEIKKVDEEKKPLAGAKFEIYNEAGEVVATGTTGEDEVAKFENLVAGKYSYKEVEAPEGYVLDGETIDFEITSDNRVIVKEVVNKKIKGALEITKVDADNKETFLAGAEFRITDKDGKEVANGTTDENGIAKFENLPYGTYYYEETKAPEGYELNSEKVEFKVTENGVVVKATVTNKKIPEIVKGSLEIKKVDEDKKPLAGAKFEIRNEAGEVVATGTTGEDGVAKFENLVAGKYSYKEIEAPEGYVLDGQAIDFEITSDNRVMVKEVVNKKIKGALELTKVDADNKETFLEGAEFRITDKDGKEVANGTTDENGIAKFENLPYGTYYYEETKAPEGYELNSEKVEFKVTENGVVVKATVTNKKVPEIIKGSLEIKKIDEEKKPLAGAKFEIYNEAGEVVATGTTGEDGVAKFEELVAGKYSYKEVEAPEGYVLDGEAIDFEITSDNRVIVKEVVNKKIPEVVKGSLEIKKVDEDKKPLAGAKFEIYNEARKVVATGTTGEDGVAKFEELVAGKYSYKEVEAPEGYILDGEAIDFEITSDNRVIVKEVVNKKIKGALELTKVDADNKETFLKGAEFSITDKDGNEIQKGITDANGIAKFENLPYGTYYYEETKAPEGYELNSEKVEFKVTENGVVVKATVTNKKVPEIVKGSLEIKKVDEEKKPLAGAKFEISNEADEVVATGTTGENGVAKFEELVAGKYSYKEVEAPEGYVLDEQVIDFEITSDNRVIVKEVVNKKIKGALELTKVDADNKETFLKGAEFSITDKDGKEVANGTTDENGIAKFENIPYGTYYYQETKAPEGYELNSEKVEFKVTENRVVVKATVTNKKVPEVIKGSLEIKKVDEEKKPLAGAKFEIKNEAGEVVTTGTTGEDGVAKFENLVAGKYSYKEIEAPEGYVLDDQAVDFEITSDNRVIVNEVVNKKIKGALELTKVDADNKETFLKGAEFRITDKDGKEVASGTTDENGIAKFENLPYGTYYYEETKAPEGYQLNGEKVEFKVTENGVVVKAIVTNKKIPEVVKGSLELIKVDSENDKTFLKGAEFNILDSEGNVVATGITDKDGVVRFEELPCGVYYYQEVKAPEGYELNSEKVKFEITDNGFVVVKKVKNKKLPVEPEEPKDPEVPGVKPDETLPETGDNGVTPYAAMSLLAVAGLFMINKKRR